MNVVVAASLMALIMLIATKPKAMGWLTLPPGMRAVGWLATAVMAVATIGFFLV